MDSFLDEIDRWGTPDPLLGKQRAKRKTRYQINQERLAKLANHNSHNRQVVFIEADVDYTSTITGSGVLIHHIRNSLSDIDCFDWVT